ncbi:MAG: hypothetical protein RIQ89_993, partial [Bacteroidota bacterium]
MTRFRFIFLVSLLCIAHYSNAVVIKLTTSNNPLKIDSALIIPLKRIDNLLFIEASVDGQYGNFLFDTGAPYLVLNKTYVKNFNEQRGEKSLGINGEGSTINKIWVDTLCLNKNCATTFKADVATLSQLENNKGIKILGLLGTSIFENCLLEIDLQKSKLSIFAHPGKNYLAKVDSILPDIETQLYTIGNIPFLEIIVNEKKLLMCFDTGAEANVFSIKNSKKVLDSYIISKKGSVIGSGSQKMEVLTGSIAFFQLGNTTFFAQQALLANISNLETAYAVKFNGILGTNFMEEG